MRHNMIKKIVDRKIGMLMMAFLIPVLIFAQGGTEEKPKYAPGKEKHRNKTDEIGRKQGQWMFFNTFGDKIAEIDFVNDQKEGVERKFYSYDKPREETEYLAGVKDGRILNSFSQDRCS
jgi:antitoxin component YwqK of YwqJK toxin-antitoxin module